MEKLKKPYTAPAAELLLLAPAENLAEETLDNKIAMNTWGAPALNTASIKGSNFTMWGEDGKINTPTK